MFKDFTKVNVAERSLTAVTKLSLLQDFASLVQKKASTGTGAASEYSRLYAQVQQTKYDTEGNITDVTSTERASVPASVISRKLADISALEEAIATYKDAFKDEISLAADTVTYWADDTILIDTVTGNVQFNSIKSNDEILAAFKKYGSKLIQYRSEGPSTFAVYRSIYYLYLPKIGNRKYVAVVQASSTGVYVNKRIQPYVFEAYSGTGITRTNYDTEKSVVITLKQATITPSGGATDLSAASSLGGFLVPVNLDATANFTVAVKYGAASNAAWGSASFLIYVPNGTDPYPVAPVTNHAATETLFDLLEGIGPDNTALKTALQSL